jgi:uncharacterized metal-binding protein YceD (DUF177 family)
VSDHEFSRMVKERPLPADPVLIEADEAERDALAERFGISAIESLSARVELDQEDKAILARGKLSAEVIQSCAVSGEDFNVSIEEPVDLRFVRETTLKAVENEDGEVEVDLTSGDSDEIEYWGDAFDLGEAVAQTLGLAIDPYAEGPGADAARKSAGIRDDDAPGGPLAEALAALKED